MALLQLIRIQGGEETILEETPVPGSFGGLTCFYSPSRIKKLEEHYKRAGKPKRSKTDVIYITRKQVERH